MNSKNLTPRERAHLAWVKSLQCSVCEQPGPSDAHHIEQGLHYACIPLCHDCHRGAHNGIHGQRRMWAVMKKTELACLADIVKTVQNTEKQ